MSSRTAVNLHVHSATMARPTTQAGSKFTRYISPHAHAIVQHTQKCSVLLLPNSLQYSRTSMHPTLPHTQPPSTCNWDQTMCTSKLLDSYSSCTRGLLYSHIINFKWTSSISTAVSNAIFLFSHNQLYHTLLRSFLLVSCTWQASSVTHHLSRATCTELWHGSYVTVVAQIRSLILPNSTWHRLLI